MKNKSCTITNIDPALFQEQKEQLNLMINDLENKPQSVKTNRILTALYGIQNFLDSVADTLE